MALEGSRAPPVQTAVEASSDRSSATRMARTRQNRRPGRTDRRPIQHLAPPGPRRSPGAPAARPDVRASTRTRSFARWHARGTAGSLRRTSRDRTPSRSAVRLPSCAGTPRTGPPSRSFCSPSSGLESELRNRVRLEMFGAFERAEKGDQFLFVARGHQRGDQDDVGDALGDGGRCRIARVDVDEIRADLVTDDSLEDCGLTTVRFNRQNERQFTTSP